MTGRLDFARVRQTVPILEVAGRLGLTVKNGRTRCLLPERHSHGDRTPSLSIDLRRNRFRCFVCPQVQGSVIDLVMQVRGVDAVGALRYLGQEGFLSETRSSQNTGEKSTKPNPVPKTNLQHVDLNEDRRKNLFTAFLKCCDPLSGEAFRYLKGRRIFAKTVERMGIRFVGHYRGISTKLQAEFSLNERVDSGLFNEQGNLRFFRHPLILPYFQDGAVHYFQGRAIDPEARPKELNPRGRVPFPYNADVLKNSDIVYICEGAIDTLTLIENGFPAVGIPGALNFKKDWIPLFVGKSVFSVLDGDSAGREGSRKLASFFKLADIPFKALNLPEGKDINALFNLK